MSNHEHLLYYFPSVPITYLILGICLYKMCTKISCNVSYGSQENNKFHCGYSHYVLWSNIVPLLQSSGQPCSICIPLCLSGWVLQQLLDKYRWRIELLPNSWGSSWQNTAIDVLIPPVSPALKAAPRGRKKKIQMIIYYFQVRNFNQQTFKRWHSSVRMHALIFFHYVCVLFVYKLKYWKYPGCALPPHTLLLGLSERQILGEENTTKQNRDIKATS